MRQVIFLSFVLGFLLFAINPTAIFCQHDEEEEEAGHKHDMEKMAKIKYGPRVESLIAEFMNTGEAIEGRPGGNETMVFEGGSKPNYYQGLKVTRSDNPMLEEDCKNQAMEFGVTAIGEFESHEEEEAGHEEKEAGHEEKEAGHEEKAMKAARKHMADHMEFIQNNKVSYAEYMQEISECKEFCGPLIASLVKCHVLSVARHEHDIIIFNLDSDYVPSQYVGGAIKTLASKVKQSPGLKIALYGRASLIGDLLYNRNLSQRRALAVKDKLMAHGVRSSSIEAMWFGWESPQISDWIAHEYDLENLYESAGKKKINQSVIAVLY